MKSALELVKAFQAKGIKIVEGTGESEAICRQYLADDFVNIEPPQMPVGGVFSGWSAPIQITDIYAKHFDIDCLGMKFFGDGGDVVAARGTWRFTSKETGRSITVPAVELFTVVGDKIKSIEVFQFDPAGIVATLPGKWQY